MAIPGLLEALRDAREVGEVAGSLDERQIELTRLGALVALSAPESSYRAHVSRALLAGASPQDVWSAVASVVTLVGVPRLLEATPLVAKALAAAED